MGFNARIKQNQKTQTATSITALAAGSVYGSTSVIENSYLAHGSCIAAEITMLVNTSSLTMAPIWQGSVDGSTWQTLYVLNNAAVVATAAGTGSDVTTNRTILLPAKVPFKYLRAGVLTGGATAHATNDKFAVKYHWIEGDFA